MSQSVSNYLRSIVILSVTFLVLSSITLPAYGKSASIILTPNEGVSAITIEGSGFNPSSVISVYWDSVKIPTLPLQIYTNEIGEFTCIISAYNQTGVGDHEVKAVDSDGHFAEATFTVVDLRGLQGEQGLPGADAEGISPGYLAGFLLMVAAIGGLIGVLIGKNSKDEQETKNNVTSFEV